jgi:hypothetical protein
MNRRDQKALVRSLTKSIANNIIRHIQIGDVPTDWDGHELRVLPADTFEGEACVSMLRKEPRSPRTRSYAQYTASGPNLFATAYLPLTPAKQLTQRMERASK